MSRRLNVRYLFLILIISLPATSWAAADKNIQPAVAIKEPAIAKSVKDPGAKELNINILWNEMEASFRATQKFRVLSRNKEVLQAVRDEQKDAASGSYKGNAAASGQLENANYLVIPTVQSFDLSRSHTALPNFDSKYKQIDSGLLEVSAQMVDTSTGQIVNTFYLKSSFCNEPQITNNKEGRPSSEDFSKMAKTVSGLLADQFVDTVFPMKIVKCDSNGQVVINRGQDGGLELGQILEVFSAGEKLIDPDTGVSLGASEEFAGKVEIVRINPMITIAKIVPDGNAGKTSIGVGSILRRPQTKSEKKAVGK